jgi:hypothetical protein
MNLTDTTRTSAIGALKSIRSKAIDTERLLLLDQVDEHGVLERAAQIEGLCRVLGLAVYSYDTIDDVRR